MALLMTARASTPGVRKSMGSRTSPVGNTSTVLKNTNNRTGMMRVSSNCSPLRNTTVNSARNCERNGPGTRLTTDPR